MYKKVSLQSGRAQPTGTIMRQWRAEQQESAWAQLMALARTPQTSDQLPTLQLPSIQTTDPMQLPHFFEYRRAADRPLQMLYGSYLESIERFGQLPEALYLANERLPELIAQMRRIGQEFDGFFHIYQRGRPTYIPVFSSLDLPPLLKRRPFSADSIIALLGPNMTSGRQEDFLL